MNFKPNESIKIVEWLCKNNPGAVKEASEQIRKPDAEFNYFFLLAKVLNAYCAKRGFKPSDITGVKLSKQGHFDRVVFIAIVLKLYSPEVFVHGGFYDMKNNLRDELSGMLECNATWISQQVSGIALHLRVYPEFCQQVEDGVTYIKSVIERKEPVEEKMGELFG